MRRDRDPVFRWFSLGPAGLFAGLAGVIFWGIGGMAWTHASAGAWAVGGAMLVATGVVWRELAHTRDQQALRRRIAELAQADESKRRFVTHLSHELRNPINGVVGAAQALETAGLAGSDRGRVRTIRACAAALGALVDDVLDLAKIEAGTIELRRERFSPRALLTTVAQMFESEAQSAGATLRVNASEDVPAFVLGDAGRVRQIITNFTANALKYAGGGAVDLSVKAIDGDLVFVVADRGPGIPPAEKEQLFASFSRLHAARAAGTSGAGLGLAISRALAERLGGRVGVEDRAGGGAVFWARLRVEPTGENACTDMGATESSLGGSRALIVEDLDYNAETLGFVLSHLGVRSMHEPDPVAALRSVREETFDAVFVDYDLPGMNGAEFVRRAKQQLRGSRVPRFVATTAHATDEMQRRCVAAGMDGFAAKPITPERIRAALGDSFSAAREGAETRQTPPQVDAEILDFLGGATESGRRASRDRFAEALRGGIARMLGGLRTGDREALRRAAHQMAGQVRMVGADNLSQLAERLERSASRGPEKELAALTGELESQVRDLLAELSGSPRATMVG